MHFVLLAERNVLCTRSISKLDRHPDVNSHEVQYLMNILNCFGRVKMFSSGVLNQWSD